VIFAVLVDTVSLAGRIVGGVLAELAKAVDVILGSIFAVAKGALETVFKVIEVLGPGLKKTVDGLIAFLNNDLVGTLNAIGDTSVVKLIWHLALALPNIIPALAKVAGVKLDPATELKQLEEARKLAPMASPGAGPPKAVGFPAFETLLPKAKQDEAVKALETLGTTVTKEAAKAFGAAQGAVEGSAKVITTALDGMDTGLKDHLDTRLAGATVQADKFAKAMSAATSAKSGLPQVDEVAAAYEKWLTGGGLQTLMGHLNELFVRDAAGPGGSPALSGIAASAAAGAPAVPVEIDRIEIRLVAPPAPVPAETPPAATAPARSPVGQRGGAFLDPDLVVVPA
jgi:hypothetical protein